MRTTIVLVIDHKKPIPNLPDLVAQRAYTIDGVQDANVDQPVESLNIDAEAAAVGSMLDGESLEQGEVFA